MLEGSIFISRNCCEMSTKNICEGQSNTDLEKLDYGLEEGDGL